MPSGSLIIEDLGIMYADFPLWLFDFFRWPQAQTDKVLNVTFTFNSLKRVPVRLLASTHRFRLHKHIDGIEGAIARLWTADMNSNPAQRNSPLLKHNKLVLQAYEMLVNECKIYRYSYCNLLLDKGTAQIITESQVIVLSKEGISEFDFNQYNKFLNEQPKPLMIKHENT